MNLLHKRLADYRPFKAIWTVHLSQYKNGLYGCIVNKLRPLPVQLHIETPLSDDGLGQLQPVPIFMEKVQKDGRTFLCFKSKFSQELTKQIRKANLLKKKL